MSNIDAIIYGGGALFEGGNTANLKASGFTTFIARCIHVEANGDLHFNDTPLVKGGTYVGPPSWQETIGELKGGETSTNRILFSVGSGGVYDFTIIEGLLATTEGTAALKRSFSALRNYIPFMDGIDLYDEYNYNLDTIIEFSKMMHSLRLHVTFCPYLKREFWVACLGKLNTETPGLVTGINLPCYDDYADNNPHTWISDISRLQIPNLDASAFVNPGLWCHNTSAKSPGMCPDTISTAFKEWKFQGIQGGFIWLYEDILKNKNSKACGGEPMGSAAYASAITTGLGG